MADVTDKKRLRQIQQQDLTESRLNDDFVYWLKNSGMNWLLGILVVVCGYSLLNYYWQRKDAARDSAWAEYTAATSSNLPESFASVANDHGSVDSVALLSWLAAGDAHLRDLQIGLIAPAVATSPDGTANPPVPLTPETRTTTQEAADGFYAKVLERLGDRKNELAMKPMAIAALFGRAAVAESRGTIDAAKGYLAEAETLAGTDFPAFADEAKVRATTLDTLTARAELPSRATLPAKPEVTPIAPSVIDELSRSMMPAAQAPVRLERGSGPPPANIPSPTPTQPNPNPQPAPTDPAGTLDARPGAPKSNPG